MKKPATKEEIIERWRTFEGLPQKMNLPSAPHPFLQYFEEDNRPQTRLDRDFERGMGISLGRLRGDSLFDWRFVGLSHNTLRGAAGGAVLIAELLCAQGLHSEKIRALRPFFAANARWARRPLYKTIRMVFAALEDTEDAVVCQSGFSLSLKRREVCLMNFPLFTGCATALITPFLPDGRLDEPALRRLLAMQMAAKMDALVLLGTTGEPCTLSMDERERIIEIGLECTGDSIPVIVGTGSNDTRRAIEYARQAQRLGAAGQLSVTPYYNKTTQSGLIRHYHAILDACPLPMILYNVPGRTGMGLSADTAAALSRHPPSSASRKPAETRH